MTEALERLQAAGLKIKPLEWRQFTGPDHQIAQCLLGVYVVLQDETSCEWWTRDNASVANLAADVGAAKRAAQADYERRILSALEFTDPPKEAER